MPEHTSVVSSTLRHAGAVQHPHGSTGLVILILFSLLPADLLPGPHSIESRLLDL